MKIDRRTFLQLSLLFGGSYFLKDISYGKDVENSMIVEKKTFSSDEFYFEAADRAIPVKIGYETYGELNEAKDNAVLICQFFTGTSHVAGKYSESDAAPGWWDTIVGPGKAIDTDKYFVIGSDVISNINFHNPDVITTGPASINPHTGKEYGMDFPIFTLKDVVRLQREMLDSLGIKKLKLVMGPSMGGLQAFMWARFFPNDVEKIISVVATPMIRPFGIMVPNQLGIDAIRLDPKWNNGEYYGKELPVEGLLLAFKNLLVATRTDGWAERIYARKFADPEFKEIKNPFKSFDGKFLVEKGIEDIVFARMEYFDANSYMYIAKANILYDLREGEETLEDALSHIKAKTLIIVDESDLMFTKPQAEEAKPFIKDCECFYYDSDNGHLSCLYETDYFKDEIKRFMGK